MGTCYTPPPPGSKCATLKTAIKLLLPLLLVGAGIVGAQRLMRGGGKAPRRARAPKPVPVEVMTAEADARPLEIVGLGRVVPARRAVLTTEVAGVVIGLHHELTAGGRIARSDEVARLDPRTYELIVQQREGQVANARLALEVEGGRGRVARREWEALAGASAPEARARLGQRVPHARAARAALAAAEAALEMAELDVARTTVEAPFDAVVLSEEAEIGQRATPQTPLAVLAGTEAFHVHVAVPYERLRWLAGEGDGEPGPARIIAEPAPGVLVEWEGRLVRTLAEVEPGARMARLVVEVAQPLDARTLPLLLGTTVRARVAGRAIPDAVAVPRIELREWNQVWVAQPDDTLSIRDVAIAWRRRDAVLVTSGVAAGERVITTRLSTPVDGMAVQIIETAPEETEEPSPKPDEAAATPAETDGTSP